MSLASDGIQSDPIPSEAADRMNSLWAYLHILYTY